MQKIRTKALWSLLAIGTLAVTLVAIPALAQPGTQGQKGKAGACGNCPMGQAMRQGQGGAESGPAGFGGPMGHPMGQIPCRMLLNPKAAQELGLTDEQKTKIKTLAHDKQVKAIDLEADLKKAHLEMRELMDEDSPNRDKIMDQIEKVGKLQTQQQKLNIGLQLDLKTLLTPEQAEKAQQLRQDFREDMRERRGEPGRGMHCGPGMMGGGRGQGGGMNQAPDDEPQPPQGDDLQ